MTQNTGNWYFAIGQDRHGPVTLEALRAMIASGQVAGTTLVWTDGMPNWVTASSHPDLAQAAAQQPQQPAQMYAPHSAPMPGSTLNYYGHVGGPQYGGFWLRFCAAFLDGLILLIPGYAVQFAIRAAFGLDILGRTAGPTETEAIAFILTFLINTTVGWLYAALQESSARQATLGKMALGLRVTDLGGHRISFGRATGRHFGKWISSIILLIGYIMAAFTERRQALHDIMAGTLVIKTR